MVTGFSPHFELESFFMTFLGASNKETLQNLHTHAVDLTNQLQGNNRVLRDCTLSQLRSGHWHLRQDYKHTVFGEPSNICTGCGASPSLATHTRRIWHLRTRTLNDLITDLIIANNNMYIFRLASLFSDMEYACLCLLWVGTEMVSSIVFDNVI